MAQGAFAGRCERCDAETEHLLKFTNPDNTEEYICWACLQRAEKRRNLKPTWNRGRREVRPRT